MRNFYLFMLIALLSVGLPAAASDAPQLQGGLGLSNAERGWLAGHRAIRVGIGDPRRESDFFAGELCQGIAFDYLTLAFRRLGISVLPVSSLAHERGLELLGKPGGVDLLLDIPHTPEHEAQLEWTTPYLRSPRVIFTRKDGHFISGIRDLAGKTVALGGEPHLAQALRRDVPGVRLLALASTSEALKAVSTGRADACLQSLAVGTYGIEQTGITNLKVAAPAPYPEHEMRFGVRPDWPELASLLDRALSSLSPQEQEEIRHRWLTLRYEHGISPVDVAKWLTLLAICALSAIVLLRRGIKSRTASLLAEVKLRSQREEELEREKRFVEHVIESLPGIFYLHDGARLLRWNSGLEKVTGLASEELAGVPPLSLIHEEDRGLTRRQRSELFERGEAQWEARLLTASGVRWYLFTGSRMELDGKAFALGTGRDITQKKLDRLALHESKRRFSDMLENLRLIAIMFDAEDRVTFCNDFLLELTGWQRSEVIGRNWFDMFYPDADESRKTFHESLGHGVVSLHRERTILTHQGARRIISWNSTVLRSPEGEEIGAACIGEDITDRRHYENALQKITEGVSATTGAAFFQSLVCRLSESLEVEYAIIAERAGGNRQVHTVAVSVKGRPAENFGYPLAWTCCERLEQSGLVLIEQGVGELYPEFRFLADHGIVSLAGVPLRNNSGEFMGTLIVLGSTPFANSELVGAMLGVFAGRAAAEMERTRAEQALKESEERYRLLFERMLNGYAVCEIVTDAQGGVDYRFLEVNASFETLTGLSRSQLIGGSALPLMPQTELLFERLGQVALTEQSDQFEEFSPGLGKWLKVAAYSPQRGQFAATFADVTKRKEAEQAVTESEEHVRQIFAQSDDGLILFEMDSFRIIEANPAALKLYGVSREELKALTPWSVIGPSNFRRLIRALARDEHGSGFQLERAACYRGDGRSFTAAIRGKVLTLRNEYVVLCTVRDITAKARLEDEMKTTQARLIQANKMTSLGMLVSGVAHEINNPNSFISVNSLMLSDVWREAAPILRAHLVRNGEFNLGGLPFSEMEAVVPRLLFGISEGSNRIASIVNNMRNFVRKEEGGLDRPIDVNRTIDNAASLLWHHIHRYTDAFAIALSENLPCARGSAQQLEQVIINLLMNALQALPGKECGVRIESGLDEESEMITISVVDEGYGMNKKVRKRLTEPFFSTKIDKGGTGLGLYISSSIIKEHHGTLTFDSAPGKGTTATIRLPWCQSKSAESEDPPCGRCDSGVFA